MTTTITGLPNGTTPLDGTERVPMDQAGVTVDATTQDIADLSAEIQQLTCRNQTGSTIAKGTAVSFAGTLGASGILLIKKTIADGTDPGYVFLGIAKEQILNGETGEVATFGKILEVDTSAFSQGSILWCDPATPGGLTETEPEAPNLKLPVAVVINSGGANGSLMVRSNIGSRLVDLHDVQANGSKTDGDALRWDAAAGRWQPEALATVATSGAYSDLTGTPILVVNLDDLGDVDLTTTPPADGEALVYDSATGDWVPGAAAAQLGDLTDVVVTTPSDGQVLEYDSATSRWINATPTGGGGTPGGSSGQIQWNDAGAFAGVGGSTVGATGDITLSLNGAASTPPLKLTGTWFVGANSKPHVLIEPSGTTSTAWSTSGTGLGVNAASGFAGNLLDLQVDGSKKFSAGTNGELKVNPVTTGAKNGIWWDNGGTVVGVGNQSDIGSGVVHGIANFGGGTTAVYRNGGLVFAFDATYTQLMSDIYLYRDAADTLAQRRSTNAQTYRLYNTYTDASNYERAKLSWNSNVFEIGTEGAGTGSARPVRITAATLKLPNLPTYADNTAATSGGLVAGDVYKTATGELRITV